MADEDPRRTSTDHTAWVGIGWALLVVAIVIGVALR